MYWIPKLHKNPTGARAIIASKVCCTKQVSKSVSNAFKLVTPEFRIFKKILNSYQIITSVRSYNILTHHSIIKRHK